MQQESADPLANIDLEDDTAATREALEKLTRLSDMRQLENFLSYGQWDLTEPAIERLQKDEEIKQRVGFRTTAQGWQEMVWTQIQGRHFSSRDQGEISRD
jgi:hypothetical protein